MPLIRQTDKYNKAGEIGVAVSGLSKSSSRTASSSMLFGFHKFGLSLAIGSPLMKFGPLDYLPTYPILALMFVLYASFPSIFICSMQPRPTISSNLIECLIESSDV